MIDFNDATPTAAHDRESVRDELRAELFSRLESVLATMFPAGKKRKGKFLIGDVLGSPGDSLEVVLDGEKAGLWTDSRYFLQASKELEGSDIELYKAGLPETPGIAAFLLRNLNENETVGLDGQTYSVADAVELNSVLKKKKIY